MPIENKHFRVEFPGDPHLSTQSYVRDNPELCVPHKNICLGQLLHILDPDLIDNGDNKHARIPVQCVYAENDGGEIYYYFMSCDNPDLNKLADNKFPELYYKILESTSPYIII